MYRTPEDARLYYDKQRKIRVGQISKNGGQLYTDAGLTVRAQIYMISTGEEVTVAPQMTGVLGHDSALLRIYWAGDNLE